MKILSLLSLATVTMMPSAAFAQEAAEAGTIAVASNNAHWGLAFACLGAAIATIVACTGSSIGVSMVAQAGAGLLTEKPNLAGKVISLVVLPGSQGLYGFVISLLFVFNFGTVISGENPITSSQGLTLMMAFLPVGFTCVTSGIFQAKVCAAGMQMIARDEKLTGRVITLAALVETYALLGFLVSFFILNNLQAAFIPAA